MNILSEREAIEYLRSKGVPEVYWGEEPHCPAHYHSYYKNYHMWLFGGDANLPHRYLYTPMIQPILTKKNIDLALKMIDDISIIEWEGEE